MMHYGTRIGASPGRGHYAESREGARLIEQCRTRLNTFLGGESARHIIFTLNTSDALNLAIKGVVRHRRLTEPGRPIHLITTDMDHNSVLRPYEALAQEPGVSLTYVTADPETGVVDPKEIERAIRPETLLISVVHVSNVSGAIQPVEAIGEICARRGVLYLVDAAQSLGHVPFDAKACRADLVAFPGHKGLMGPQGTGGLYVRPGVEHRLATVREGGTGHLSELPVQPEEMPQKYEAGSHNTIGIVGLSEGVKWLMERGQEACREHESGLIETMLTELAEQGAELAGREQGDGPLRGLKLLGPADARMRCGTFTFVHDVLEPGEMAAAMEEGFGVLVRAGIHCAPRAHRLLGSLRGGEQGGALRMSMGPFVTVDDVRWAVQAMASICGSVRAAM